MNFSPFARTLADSVGLPLFVVAIILVIASVGIVCYQTRSLLPITLGLWRLVMRRAPAPDRTLQEAMNQRVSLLWFLFFFRIKVRTLGQAKSVLRWCRVNDLEPSSIAACTPEFFDVEVCEFLGDKVPSMRWILLRFSGAVVALLLVFSMIALALVPQAVIKFRESRQWVRLSKDAVRTSGGQYLFAANECSPPRPGKVGELRPDEVVALCELFASGKAGDYVKNTVREQRYAAAYALFPMMFAALLMLKWFWSAAAAADIRSLLRRREQHLVKRKRPPAARTTSDAMAPN